MKRPLSLLLLALPALAQAVTLGTLRNQNVSDNATVCMSVGLMASITGLDDIRLTSSNGTVSGSARAQYKGGDSFHLSSNGQVSVLVSSSGLKNGNSVLNPNFSFDNNAAQTRLNTQGDTHDADHRLDAAVMLAGISSQKAGSYNGTVTLTVTPAIGGLVGCGESTAYFPSKESWSILAWEDLYPNAGDKDYNDMVVAMRVSEDYNSQSQLKHVSMDFIPIARGAGYDHSLMLSLDGSIDKSKNVTTITDPVFFGDAKITLTQTNLKTGNSTTQLYNPTQNITLFSSTQQAAGGSYVNVYANSKFQMPALSTHLEIDLASPELNPATRGLAVDDFLYRPYLHVLNTGYDIDLYTNNTANGMATRDGYPFGLMMPMEWAWPAERVSIDAAYPYFKDYRSWLSGQTTTLSEQAANWYNYPSQVSNLVVYPQIDYIEPLL